MKKLQDLTLFDKFLFDETMAAFYPSGCICDWSKGTHLQHGISKGKEKYCYTFRTRCDEDPSLLLEDGTVRIFLNSHGTNPEEVSAELVEFLKYMESTDAFLAENSKNEKIKQIHKHVSQIKANEEMGVKYMQKWEERVYDREKGREEGKAEGLIETAISMYKNGISKPLIAKVTGFSEEKIDKILKN